MSSKKNETEEESAIPIGLFKEGVISIEGELAKPTYENGHYGTLENENRLILEAEEAILLMERSRLELNAQQPPDNSSRPVKVEDLVRYYSAQKPDFLAHYLVYKDLRNRGYIVRIGSGEINPYRVYPRGSKPGQDISKISVFPLPEGRSLDLSKLNLIVKQARASRKKLLLGVIDRIGDVTYYKASQLDLQANKLAYKFPNEHKPSSEELEEEEEE
ncbi:MAG: tRNA-intron lyase [Promethearchaeota archaeon]